MAAIYIEKSGGNVYTSVQNHIMTLQIVKKSPTNLERDVINVLFAKYMCKSAIVMKIEDDKGQSVTKINSDKLIYEVGVAIAQIHFFLTKERAILSSLSLDNYTGPYTDWDDTGLILKQCSFVNGLLDGTCTEFKNRRPKTQYQYKKGILHGPCVMWDNYGGKTNCSYHDGVLNGEYNSWYSGGDKCAMKRFYINGKLEGISQFWTSSGMPIELETYKNGSLHGKFISWNDDGSIARQFYYITTRINITVNGVLHERNVVETSTVAPL